MVQLELKATEKPGLSALAADAKRCGELKDVAAIVYPKSAQKDPEKARDDLSDALRASHARKLDIDELIPIVVAVVTKTHRSALIEHILAQLPKDSFEFRWLTKEEKLQRVTSSLADALPVLVDLVKRAEALVNGGSK